MLFERILQTPTRNGTEGSIRNTSRSRRSRVYSSSSSRDLRTGPFAHGLPLLGGRVERHHLLTSLAGQGIRGERGLHNMAVKFSAKPFYSAY